MSLLKSVTSGPIKRPHYILMHGMPGIGKSTFAASFPKPIFLCSERGTAHLNVSRLELNTFDQFMSALLELKTTNHDYQTVVIDTLDHLEPMIHAVVAKDKNKSSINDIGYKAGYDSAVEYWQKFEALLDDLRMQKNMNIIELAHTYVKAHNDPQLPEPYDTYKIKMHHKAADFLVDRAEVVLFASYLVALDPKEGKKKAYGDGSRILYTEHRPAFTAKNQCDLPFSIPFDESFNFDAFDKLCHPEKTSQTPELVKAQIAELMKELKDKAQKEKIDAYVAANGNDTRKLIAALSRLKTIVAA